VTEIGDRRLFELSERTPGGHKFVAIELYIFNSGSDEINTDAIWWGEIYSLNDSFSDDIDRLGVEVWGEATNARKLNLDVNKNPDTGKQDGCTTRGRPDIPAEWGEGFDIYLPPGENLPWKLCFVVPEEDLPTLVLRWPHFIDGPAIWFALHPESP